MENLKPDLLICACHSTDHQLIFLYDEDEFRDKDGNVRTDENGNVLIDRTVFIHVHLNDHSFWERLKHGIKHIFGYKSRYGAFDEFIIKPEDVDKFEKVVEFLKK